MKCKLTDEEHALYLPGCVCGADPLGLIKEIHRKRKQKKEKTLVR